MQDHDASKPSHEFQRALEEANRHRGISRKLRIIIAEAQYALALHDGELGDPGVRKNWERHTEKMWRARRAPDTQARATLLMAVVFAERNYAEPRLGWKKPRETVTNFFAKDAKGTTHTISMSVPFEQEAAEEAIKSVAAFDPENAAKIPPDGLAAIIPVFANRHANVGRRGKPAQIDEALCELAKAMGLGAITAAAMRRQRTEFERRAHVAHAEKARAYHQKALAFERKVYGLESPQEPT
jgi:hypothetical protein